MSNQTIPMRIDFYMILLLNNIAKSTDGSSNGHQTKKNMKETMYSEKNGNDQVEGNQDRGCADSTGIVADPTNSNPDLFWHEDKQVFAKNISNEYEGYLNDVEHGINKTLSLPLESKEMKEVSGGHALNPKKQSIVQKSILNLFMDFKKQEGFTTDTKLTELLNMVYFLVYSRNFIPILNKYSLCTDDLLIRTSSIILRAYNAIADNKLSLHTIDAELLYLKEKVRLQIEKYHNIIESDPDVFAYLLQALSPHYYALDLICFQGEALDFNSQVRLLAHDRWIFAPNNSTIENLINSEGELSLPQPVRIISTPMFFFVYKNRYEDLPCPNESITICGSLYKILAIYIFSDNFFTSLYPTNLENPLGSTWFSFVDNQKIEQDIRQKIEDSENEQMFFIYEKTSERDMPATNND